MILLMTWDLKKIFKEGFIMQDFIERKVFFFNKNLINSVFGYKLSQQVMSFKHFSMIYLYKSIIIHQKKISTIASSRIKVKCWKLMFLDLKCEIALHLHYDFFSFHINVGHFIA